ncbi:MAG: DUF4340 domain-containing protein [Bradymonadales bacterium]|jgi:hypothetical protein
MTKTIKILLLALVAASLLYFFLIKPKSSVIKWDQHTASWSKVDAIEIIKGEVHDYFYRSANTWNYKAAGDEVCAPKHVDAAQFKKIDAILSQELKIDLIENTSSLFSNLGLSDEAPVVVLYSQNIAVDRFKLGKSMRPEHSNEERTWIQRDEGEALRVFVPLYDLGSVFSQELRLWRHREIFSFDSHDIDRISVRAGQTSYALQKHLGQNNSAEWRLVDDESFDLDQDAIEALLLQIANLSIDNFADCIDTDTVMHGIEGGSLSFEQNGEARTIQIGIQAKLHPEAANWRDLKEGDRLSIIEGRVAILSKARVMSLLPDLTLLRQRRVLAIDRNELERIDFLERENTSLVRRADGSWDYTLAGAAHEIQGERLALLLRQLQNLRAVRYASPAEEDGIEWLDGVEITTKQDKFKISWSSAGNGFYFAKINDGDAFILMEVQIRRMNAFTE